MKVFGNSGNNGSRSGDKKRTPQTGQPQPPRAGAHAPQGPNAKKPNSKSGSVKESMSGGTKGLIAAAIVLVILALGITGYAVWTTMVRAPTAPLGSKNDANMVDSVSGDQVTLGAETGDRIAEYFTFVVGAVDEDETRTDALMVVGFDTKNKKINILNVPRDTMSDVSRLGASKKINAAYGTKKGIEQTKKEVKMLVGFTPDYYMVVNFQGIADIVDAIGGVDYEIPFRMYYKDPTQNLSIDFKPGMTHMDGKQVVEFLRWRKNNGGVKTGDSHYTGGDEERIDKQQEFLKYLATQVLDMKNITKISSITKAVFDNVKTDFTKGELLWMGMQAVGLESESIQMHTLPGYAANSYAGTGDSYSFFFPNEEETLALVNEYFNPYVNKLTNLDIVSGPTKTGSGSGRNKPKPSTPETAPQETAPQETTPPVTTDPEATPPTTDGTVTPPTTDGTATPPTTDGTVTPPTTDGTVTPPTTTPPATTAPNVPNVPTTPGTPNVPAPPSTPPTADPEA